MDAITLSTIVQLKAGDAIFAAGRLSTDPEFPKFAIADIRRSMQRIEEALSEFEAGKAEMPRAAE